MGKAAYNEKQKLRATFFNNLSLGAALTGAFTPSLIVYQKAGGLFDGSVSFSRDLIGGALALLISIILALLFRYLADREIDKIQD